MLQINFSLKIWNSISIGRARGPPPSGYALERWYLAPGGKKYSFAPANKN